MTSSVIYDSYFDDLNHGNIAPATDTFYVMLVNGYTPNQATHTKRSDVTSESTGTGYTSGGVASAVTLSLNTSTHTANVSFASVSWPSSTITATGAVIYKHRGGLASADNLVAYVDFSGSISDSAGTFTVNFSTPLAIIN